MKINKKASRDPNLYIFSHEHHHGLVFSVRLKKANKTDSATLKKYILHFWNNALVDHFKNEEDLFLDHLTQKEIKNQFINEHKSIREQALDLSVQLKAHIKFEEKILFPWLQDNLSQELLNKIGTSLENIEVKADDFEPKFWE